jgi:NADPH:quinone reductase-like Zn-dependent oxidoreductase
MQSTTIPSTMNAILFDSFGSSSVLKVGTTTTPQPKAGEVLIKISHTSVNPVDWKIREGYLQGFLPHALPIIPGWDVAGTIVALGQGSKAFQVNDRVFAYARLPEVKNGTYAEYIALPENFVAALSSDLKNEEAAGIPLVALTAYQGLHENVKIQRGDRVLITAGAGGVGSLAIQFAKLAGAIVTTTASGKNHEYVRALGADHVIDYTSNDVVNAARSVEPHGFDVVFDGAGGDSLKQAWTLIKNGGRLVSIVDTPDAEVAKAKSVDASFHFVYPDGKALATIGKLIAEKKVKLPAFEVKNVREAAAAQDENQKRHVRGKVVLAVDFKA